MRYYTVRRDGEQRLVVENENGIFDLTSACEDLGRFKDLARAAVISESSVDEIADRHLDAADELDPAAIESPRQPVVPDEVWAAGVTYRISEEAREAESSMPEMYLNVYDSERPEIFFKATPNRTVGPDEDVGVREDSDWDVPEPELGVVLYRGEPVGYTIGNDMSSRGIEGENPLYLPQAKVYDRCCSVGPAVASPSTIGDPHDLEMTIDISRDGETLFRDSTSTGEMDRTCEELVSYYTRHNSVPDLAILLTGTALVPDDEFSLEPDDKITIDVENIGQLRNDVRTV
ncbi:fumarylacetoacetate hydrolase family protein [Haloarcula nitratireducens]|uniref:Fumarylacetoacetate hydrolase family protein n=1 Tax=Haloarcula nitratireducens TaxID=2487749 RepID=A0AAW4PGI8_9EURY|nr:fumarylacetoacetate hydrolase family protein [Halomicroarcula nitratireducens]MBX0297031.1 fumarylacetoacetate hydrolase family protein [Halomicroarcula nitratireducens]